MNNFYKIVLICLSIQLLGCATPAVVQRVDAEVEKKAKLFQVEQNKSKIYFLNGKMTSGFINPIHSYPSDILVNDVFIGSMNKENVMVIDVAPGSYDISWMPRSTDPIDKKAIQNKLKINAQAGQAVILQGDYSMGGAAGFGYLGAMVSPPATSVTLSNKDEVASKVVVHPQNCAPTICIK